MAAKTSIGSKAAIIYDMSVASIFGKEYINTIAILGGVIGFWGGILVLGIIYLILVCIRRLRKHTTTEGSGGAVVRAMMGGYTDGDGGFDGRPPTRTDQIPRERKARKAHHHASFYARGPRRRDQDSGGIGLGRLGEFSYVNDSFPSFISHLFSFIKEQYRTRTVGADETRKYGKLMFLLKNDSCYMIRAIELVV